MHKSLRLIVLMLACLVLIAPVRAQGPPPPLATTEYAISWAELIPTIMASLLTGGGIFGLLVRGYVRRQESLFKERMTRFHSESDEVKRKDDLFKQLLELYGKNAAVTQNMVTEMGRFGGKFDHQGELLRSQTAVLLNVGKDITAHSSALETVRGIMMSVLDEEKAQTQHGLTVIQMLEDIASKVDAVLAKMKTGDLSKTATAKLLAEAQPALITPPPNPSTIN